MGTTYWGCIRVSHEEFRNSIWKEQGPILHSAEVSRILAKVVGIDSTVTQDMTVYDPTCGSGSLLLKAANEAPNGITIYGQENDNATWALSKMNMIIHGNEAPKYGRTIHCLHRTSKMKGRAQNL